MIWTVLPILPHDLPSIVKGRLLQDGLWGFTGYTPDSPPPSPSLLPTCLPALSDWHVKEESLIRTPRGTKEEEIAVREAGLEVHKFVIATWREREWETAWFVNPPVSTIPNCPELHSESNYSACSPSLPWHISMCSLDTKVHRR